MENMSNDDRSAEIKALRAEIADKLPEDKLCAINTIYALLDIVTSDTAIDAAEHLFNEHNNLFAGEFVLSFLRFLDSAGRLEATWFMEHDVQGLRRFDVKANAETLAEFEAAVSLARITDAVTEGESHVKH